MSTNRDEYTEGELINQDRQYPDYLGRHLACGSLTSQNSPCQCSCVQQPSGMSQYGAKSIGKGIEDSNTDIFKLILMMIVVFALKWTVKVCSWVAVCLYFYCLFSSRELSWTLKKIIKHPGMIDNSLSEEVPGFWEAAYMIIRAIGDLHMKRAAYRMSIETHSSSDKSAVSIWAAKVNWNPLYIIATFIAAFVLFGSFLSMVEKFLRKLYADGKGNIQIKQVTRKTSEALLSQLKLNYLSLSIDDSFC